MKSFSTILLCLPLLACGSSQVHPDGDESPDDPVENVVELSSDDIVTRPMDPLIIVPPEPFEVVVNEEALTLARAELAAMDPIDMAVLTQGPGPALITDDALRSDEWIALGAYYGIWYGDTPSTFEGTPEPVEVHQLVLQREPWFEVLEDGTFVVRWETLEPAPRGHAYWGVAMPDQWIALPRYRRDRAEDLEGESTDHEFRGILGRLERDDYDVSNLVENAGGVIEVRVEQYIPAEGSTRLYDRRFAYARDVDATTEEVTYRRVPTIVEGPFVDFDGEVYTISFDTDFEVRASVALSCGETEDAVASNVVGTHHEIRLNALPQNEVAFYQVILEREGEQLDQRPWFFRTEAGPESAFTFAVMSDSRAGVGAGERAYDGVNLQTLRGFLVDAFNEDAQFVVFPGDLIDGYTTQRSDYMVQMDAWQDAAEVVHRLMPIFEGMGNHEAYMDAYNNGTAFGGLDGEFSEDLFAMQVVNPTNGPVDEGEGTPSYSENVYSWDYGNSHFVMLNSNYFWSNLPNNPDAARVREMQNREGYIMDAQLEWLRADLASARERGIEHIFAFTHEPPFPNSFHYRNAMYWRGEIPEVLERRDELISTLIDHGVLAIFTGDEHNYSRTLVDGSISDAYDGAMWSLVTGGCGAPYYNQIDVPWTDNVMAFTAQKNWIEVVVNGDSVYATVRSDSGQVVDEFEMTNTER